MPYWSLGPFIISARDTRHSSPRVILLFGTQGWGTSIGTALVALPHHPDRLPRTGHRINIKVHGARFHRAAELVHLEPNDCFALATHKIHSSLRKQEQEGLPHFFAIVGVSDLSGENVASRIPTRFIDAASLFRLKRFSTFPTPVSPGPRIASSHSSSLSRSNRFLKDSQIMPV